MLLRIYKIISYLIYPFVPIYLGNRLSLKKELKDRINERYGYSRINRKKGKLVWLHAASIDESTKIGRALHFSRNIIPANIGKHYYHIGVYSYRPRSLKAFVLSNASILEKREKLEQLRALENGMNISVAFVENKPIGVDTYDDFENAVNYFNA